MKKLYSKYKYSIWIALSLTVLYLLSCLNRLTNIDSLLYNRYVLAFIFGYIVNGILADLITRELAKKVWERTKNSYLAILRINNKKATEKDIPFWLHNKNREPFNWAPRTIGVIERILYTTAIIFNQYLLIGVWLAFKAIGEWSDFSFSKNKRDLKRTEDKNDVEEGTTRIRANNFLIGTGITLIFGILGGLIFKQIVDNNFIYDFIDKSSIHQVELR